MIINPMIFKPIQKDKDMLCKNCFFFESTDQRHGACHRNPPKNVFIPAQGDLGVDEYVPLFPTVMLDDWCGDFRRGK